MHPAHAAEEAERFGDVAPGTFHADAVEWAHENGVVTGITPDCFFPDQTATRAEVAAVLQRLIAPEASPPNHGFTDVASEWQQLPVAWMADAGVTKGVAPGRFGPNLSASRVMVATFLWRIEGEPEVRPITNPFLDVPAGWQRAPVEWLWQAGLTTGRTPTEFAPARPVTRGELLTFVWRWRGKPWPPELAPPEPVNCLVATGQCSDLFPASFVDELTSLAGGRRVTAQVNDQRTGCTYALHPDIEMTTASIIKAQILAGVILDAQDRGVSVSAGDKERIALMIRYSHNSPPTSELYSFLGGAAGMEALDTRFGVEDTRHTSLYGATLSTAADRTRLIEQLLIGGGPLDDASVVEAWEWMSTVAPWQSWGVSAGLPAGYLVAAKNGFFPLKGAGWRLGTTGVVRDRDGGEYAVTVMTDGNETEATGIELVEFVTSRINEMLTAGDPVRRAVDLVTCIEATAGATWEIAAGDLRTDSPEELRRDNGGEPAPLVGQRVCVA